MVVSSEVSDRALTRDDFRPRAGPRAGPPVKKSTGPGRGPARLKKNETGRAIGPGRADFIMKLNLSLDFLKTLFPLFFDKFFLTRPSNAIQ